LHGVFLSAGSFWVLVNLKHATGGKRLQFFSLVAASGRAVFLGVFVIKFLLKPDFFHGLNGIKF